MLNRPEGFATREFVVLLIIACGLWLVAAGLMARLSEVPGATSGGGNALREALRSLRLIVEDANFRNFVIARALLASTVLSMPFYVILAQDATGGRLAGLGILLVASSSATALSASVWGWMADRSSRRTMAVAGLCAALIGCVTFLVSGTGIEGNVALWVYGGLFFLIGLAHTGIRIGRKTYLVDSAPSEQRASYVALSNTLIGIVLLLSGSFGLLTPFVGVRGVVLVFALLGLAGGVLAFVLREAEA
jgi:MFS family permease